MGFDPYVHISQGHGQLRHRGHDHHRRPRRRSPRHDRERLRFGLARSAAGAGLRRSQHPHSRPSARQKKIRHQRALRRSAGNFRILRPPRARPTSTPRPRPERASSAPSTELPCCTERWPIWSAACTRHKRPATTPSSLPKSRMWSCTKATRFCSSRESIARAGKNRAVVEIVVATFLVSKHPTISQ